MEILRPVFLGFLAVVAALLPRTLQELYPALRSPGWGIGIAVAFAVMGLVWLRRSGVSGFVTDGPADGVRFLHQPERVPSVLGSAASAVIAFLLSVFGAGAEGVAAEGVRTVQRIGGDGRSFWSDRHRRTEAAILLTTAVGAAFNAPWAGLAWVTELGIGGRLRTVLIAAVSVAFFAHALPSWGWLSSIAIDPGSGIFGFSFGSTRDWLVAGAVGLMGGALSAASIRFLRVGRVQLRSLAPGRPEWIALGSVLFLFLLPRLAPVDFDALVGVERLLWLRGEPGAMPFELLAVMLALLALHAGLGVFGILSPVWLAGALMAAWLDRVALAGLGPAMPTAALLGGAAFFAAFFGTPIAAALIAAAMSGNAAFTLPALAVAVLAIEVRKLLRTRSLIDLDLADRGLLLQRGRSLAVLERVRVMDAMARDFLFLFEHERVSDVQSRVAESPYAFFPIVDAQSRYLGLLSLDALESVWRAARAPDANPQLDHLLEVRDLLYRTRVKAPLVLATQSLAAVDDLLDEHSCLAVSDEQRKVIGLLFAHQLRVVYELEANRERF